MLQLYVEFVLFIVSIPLGLTLPQHSAQEGCLEPTRPHKSRCELYFRCSLLPSKTAVWITTQCRKGLVYQHNLNSCVVPASQNTWMQNPSYFLAPTDWSILFPILSPVTDTDSDWQCDLPSELEHNNSTDRYQAIVYSTDNLHQQALPPSRSPPTTNRNAQLMDFKLAQHQLPKIEQNEFFVLLPQEPINETHLANSYSEGEKLQSSSVKRTVEHSNTNSFMHHPSNFKTLPLPRDVQDGLSSSVEQSPPKPLDILSSSFQSPLQMDYTILSAGQSNHGKLPLPPNGKIHPEHLTQIINQQKQLNRFVTHIKQQGVPISGVDGYAPLENKLVFSRQPALTDDHIAADDGEHRLHHQQFHTKGDKNPTGKEPYVSEDIIKSILQISHQMIANHHKPSVAEELQESEHNLYTITEENTSTNLPIALQRVTPSKSKITATFNSKPISISFTNPYSLSHTAVYDNLRNQPLNESTYYSTFQPMLYDIYGNRFVSKDALSQATPQVNQYRPYLSSTTPPPSLLHIFPVRNYPNFMLPYISPTQSFKPAASTIMSTQNTNYQLPILLQMQHNLTGQDVTSNALDRVEESDESSDSINLDSDQKILSNESSDESEQIEAENTSKLSSVPDASFKHKLYTQAPVTLEYNSYKDSIVPLLDTNPSDVRISVAMCTLGSREPNKTDCFKYFVCNPHNGAFQSFTCPSFTAFNKDSRLCDTASYQVCMTQKIDVSTNRPAILYKGSLSQHSSHLSKNDLLTAQKYAELIRLEANKLLTRNSMPLPPEQVVVMPGMHTVSTAVLDAVKPTGKIRRKSSSGKRKHAQITTMTSTTTTTATPTAKCCNSVRKAPRCRAEGRVPNPMDEYSYYVCHRKNQRKFVKMKITCPSGQKYCAASQYCTSSC